MWFIIHVKLIFVLQWRKYVVVLLQSTYNNDPYYFYYYYLWAATDSKFLQYNVVGGGDIFYNNCLGVM
jgi:hypothetical protein